MGLTDVASRASEALRPDIEISGRTLEALMESAEVHADPDVVAQARS